MANKLKQKLSSTRYKIWAKRQNKTFLSLLFYLLGVGLLIYLIFQMDLDIIATSFREMGYGVLVVFATAISWIVVNTWSISILLGHSMSFKKLLYVELTGNAYNNIIPMAGFGGEPYKFKIMSENVGMDKAGRAIVHNRLIQSVSGALFTALMCVLTLLIIELPRNYEIVFIIASVVYTFFTFLLTWLTLSKAPVKFSGFLLKKLKFIEAYQEDPLDVISFWKAVFWQTLGRALSLLEIYIIFVLLHFHPSFADLLCVSAFLSLSSALFFFIPQGIGVNEAGISAAFSILGYSASLGLSFGLIRRARVLVWAVLGIVIHLIYVLRGVSTVAPGPKEETNT